MLFQSAEFGLLGSAWKAEDTADDCGLKFDTTVVVKASVVVTAVVVSAVLVTAAVVCTAAVVIKAAVVVTVAVVWLLCINSFSKPTSLRLLQATRTQKAVANQNLRPCPVAL